MPRKKKKSAMTRQKNLLVYTSREKKNESAKARNHPQKPHSRKKRKIRSSFSSPRANRHKRERERERKRDQMDLLSFSPTHVRMIKKKLSFFPSRRKFHWTHPVGKRCDSFLSAHVPFFYPLRFPCLGLGVKVHLDGDRGRRRLFEAGGLVARCSCWESRDMVRNLIFLWGGHDIVLQ